MKWRATGFSPRRVAWTTAVLSLLLVPAHFYVSCYLSGRVAMAGIGLLAITGLLSLADRTENRAIPFMLAVAGIVAHMLCTH